MRVEPPEGLHDAVLRAATDLLPGRLGETLSSWSEAGDADVDVVSTRPLYAIGLDAIAERRGAGAAIQVGWRSIVTIGSRPVALADANDEDVPVVYSLNYGPFVAGLTRAGQWPDRKSASYGESEAHEGQNADQGPQERVLLIPALYLTAIWLHDDDEPSRDEVIPAAPAPAGVAANEPVLLAELLESLAERARLRLSDGEEADA